MKLIGGPYNNREIEDLGQAGSFCLGLRRTENGKVMVGSCHYEIGEDRSQAFWLTNEWLGTIEGIIEA